MKDIKQYFANDRNVSTDSSNVIEHKEQEKTIVTGRCKRVKIRICDIINNRNDLIEKTPSPFNKVVNNSHKMSQDRTPKSDTNESDVRQLEKYSEPTVKMDGNHSKEMGNISQEKGLNKQIIDTDSSPNNSVIGFNDETESNKKFHDKIGSRREESNAFQVLMNRNKKIQYKLSPQQSTEDIESKEKSDYVKELKSKCKEKLIALANKKGYSKRKMAEIEEGERIEKNIENRIGFLKGENKSDITHKKDNSFEVSIKNTKQSGNLLNYFSKSPLELTNKNEKCMSSFIVKADVHKTDDSDVVSVTRSISNKRHSNKKYPKSELDPSSMDDIHVIESENLFPPQIVKQDEQKREKLRWSLRIKLHSSKDNGSLNDTDDEALFSPKSKSKSNTTSKSGNFVNEENNEIHTKDRERYLKRMRNKEKKESFVKDDNILNIAKVSVKTNGDTDLKKSNGTNKNEQKNNMKKTIITTINDCEIIESENILKRKSNEKLAPLFIKRRKTNPDMAARRLFLQSDIIDVENKNIDHKSNSGTSMLSFPSISHVTQLENELDLTKSEIEHKFSIKIKKKYLPSMDVNNYKYITNYMKASRANKTINESAKETIEQVLSEIEKLYPDVRKMWKIISMIKGDSEKKSPPRLRNRKTRTLERKIMLMESIGNEENQSYNCIWTYKYKPMSSQEIVGNEEAANKLKDWLSGWRVSLRENDGSSGDEFYSSDCSSSYNNESNQIAVLLGPHGSGKSASVYAIAEELGYSVLEVNASSRRTGKRILKELEEATKSHRIKKSNHKSSFEQITNETETSKILQNSLILLEDIDLIFEEDEGFISAAYQLASNTKRPIVMTCRDICPHLNKMAPQQNKIYFHKVNGSRVSALLELISLAETGYRIPHNCLMKLLQVGDLRQALLQLQYLLLSGPPVLSEQSTTAKLSFWQDMQHYLYKPVIKRNKKYKTKKSTNAKNSNILNNLAENLDSLSLATSLIDVEDIMLDMSEMYAQPNLSLVENVSFYSALHDLNADIANFINKRIVYKDFEESKHVQNQSKIILQKQLNRGVDLALSHVTSVCLDGRIMALDYLPTARAICRAEESRSTANYKRGNRFFHYLHGLKMPNTSTKPNILSAACRMLQEREKKLHLHM